MLRIYLSAFLLLPIVLIAQVDEETTISKTDFSTIFNGQLAKIELIALQNYPNEYGEYIVGVTAINIHESNYVTAVNHNRFAIRKELSQEHYYLLYRLFYTPSETDLHPYGLCYYPRHAILFSSAQGETLAYVEICFECKQKKWLGMLPTLISYDKNRWNELKELFAMYQFPFNSEE